MSDVDDDEIDDFRIIRVRGRGGRGRRGRGISRGIRRIRVEGNSQEERGEREQRNLEFIPKIEVILSYPHLEKDFKISNNNKMKLYDFKKNNLMKYEEDILFYCSSPKTLENYKSNIDDDKNYNFYNDIDSEYYMDCQKQRFKTILSISEPLIKTKKLSNYKKSFCVKASKIEETFEKKIENSNVIRTKLDEYSNKIINEVNIFNVLNHLKELKKIFKNNIIDMENLGLIQFNFIENNLILLLNLIKNKFEQENNTKLLTEFI